MSLNSRRPIELLTVNSYSPLQHYTSRAPYRSESDEQRAPEAQTSPRGVGVFSILLHNQAERTTPRGYVDINKYSQINGRHL